MSVCRMTVCTFLRPWRSNAMLFFVSMGVGFALGSGCIFSSQPSTQAPADFRLVITEVVPPPVRGGRLTVDASGLMEFEDWSTSTSVQRAYREQWRPEQVDSLYLFLTRNGLPSFRSRYPDVGSEQFFHAGKTITIEAQMRGMYQAVHVIAQSDVHLPSGLRNILQWYARQKDTVRYKLASGGS